MTGFQETQHMIARLNQMDGVMDANRSADPSDDVVVVTCHNWGVHDEIREFAKSAGWELHPGTRRTAYLNPRP